MDWSGGTKLYPQVGLEGAESQREAREGLMKTADQGGIASTFFSLKLSKPSNLGTLQVVQWFKLCFHCGGTGLIPGEGTKIPHCRKQNNNSNKNPQYPRGAKFHLT